MSTKINIFNFITKIKELADQLETTQKELANIKKLNAISNSLTGMEIVKAQNAARQQIINEFFPKELWGKEITYFIDKNIVDEWLHFAAGQFDSETVVEVRNDRLAFRSKDKDKIIFRYFEGLNTIGIQIL